MNPATAQLIAMVLQGILRIVPETAADWDFIKGWIAFCDRIVSENRDPTPEEVAEAHGFAEAEHGKIQGA
jgi:hypothetical protein